MRDVSAGTANLRVVTYSAGRKTVKVCERFPLKKKRHAERLPVGLG